MSGIITDGIDVSDILIDTSNAETFINDLIPIKTLVITSYLIFGIPIDIFYIVPYLVYNFIYYNKRKKVFIH